MMRRLKTTTSIVTPFNLNLKKLYEDSTRLSSEFRMYHQELHIDDLRGIRNRVAHDYESVSLKILIDTVKEDIPVLKTTIVEFLEKQAKK